MSNQLLLQDSPVSPLPPSFPFISVSNIHVPFREGGRFACSTLTVRKASDMLDEVIIYGANSFLLAQKTTMLACSWRSTCLNCTWMEYVIFGSSSQGQCRGGEVS